MRESTQCFRAFTAPTLRQREGALPTSAHTGRREILNLKVYFSPRPLNVALIACLKSEKKPKIEEKKELSIIEDYSTHYKNPENSMNSSISNSFTDEHRNRIIEVLNRRKKPIRKEPSQESIINKFMNNRF